jgi:hypothetical protein
MHKNFIFSRAGVDQSDKPTDSVGSADFPSTEVKTAKLTAVVGSADSLVTSPVNSSEKLPNRPNKTSSGVGADLDD